LKMSFRSTNPRKLREQGLGRSSPAEVEKKFFRHLEDLETILKRHGWLVGAAPSIADFSVAAQLDEIVRTSRLAERVLAHSKIKDWLTRASGAPLGNARPTPSGDVLETCRAHATRLSLQSYPTQTVTIPCDLRPRGTSRVCALRARSSSSRTSSSSIAQKRS